jgi:hypothetical protein
MLSLALVAGHGPGRIARPEGRHRSAGGHWAGKPASRPRRAPGKEASARADRSSQRQAWQIENTGFALLPVSIDASLLEMVRHQAGNAQPGIGDQSQARADIETEPGARQGSRHQAGQIEPMPDFRPEKLSLALVIDAKPDQ